MMCAVAGLVDEAWGRIVAWLPINVPTTAARVNPPVTGTSIAAAQREFGQSLPADLVQWWHRADGVQVVVGQANLLPPCVSQEPGVGVQRSAGAPGTPRQSRQRGPPLQAPRVGPTAGPKPQGGQQLLAGMITPPRKAKSDLPRNAVPGAGRSASSERQKSAVPVRRS